MEPARSSSAETTTTTGAITGRRLLLRSYSAGSSSSSGRVRERVVRLRRRAREHRARFYIARRCLHMLLCWHDDT
ncbi:small polypeptide DEVIL 11-like [Hordeum vulgare subsp. vulgare]|uniref:small polypeptide DEVIL 11-like n=1 Tax=Hordeum vulgare subsp. vulgare TaxID=112509 RepID=UPI000B482B64|nr:small polypeptide DEVIL 11-like [Hordeum vulgare subsp. vulgare]